MKQIDWQAVATQVRELYPNVVQIAAYSRDRWLLVFDTEPDSFLNTFHPLNKLISKHHLRTPLIVNRQFISSSLDSYPLEFLDIQSAYTNLFVTEDEVAKLKFDKNDVRLEVERELKSKWLLTRLTALQYDHHSRRLFEVLQESYTALLPVFKGFCYLSGVSIPAENDKLLDKLEDILHTDVRIFREIASQTKAPSKELISKQFNDYLRLLSQCIEVIDKWNKE